MSFKFKSTEYVELTENISKTIIYLSKMSDDMLVERLLNSTEKNYFEHEVNKILATFLSVGSLNISQRKKLEGIYILYNIEGAYYE